MQEGSAAGNKYKIIKTIGSGGMSVVYLAEDMVLQCVWAVKVVRKGVTAQEKWKEKQILSEAMLLKRLNHPGFPRIVDLYHEEACTCIVMDYIEGRTLEELLQEKGPGSEKEVISRARQLCDMLSYLHKMEPPVYYGDLKPANVICSESGRLYLIDFGIAATGAEKNGDFEAPGQETCTRMGQTLRQVRAGTPGFAAPEQLQDGIFSVRTDVYAFGMTLYTLLTGLDPRSKAFRQLNQGKSLQFPDGIVQCSPGLQEIIRKCTRNNPAARYRDCRELMRDLLQPVRPAVLQHRRQIRKQILSAVVISLVLLISGIAIFRRAVREFTEEEIYAAKLEPDRTREADEKERSYIEAIELQPESSEGFLRLLELYETEMEFGEQESRQLLEQFHQSREGLSADPDLWNETLCRIGRLYFFRFQGGDGSVRERILRAEPFFAEWKANAGEKAGFEEDAEEAADAACLNKICTFYKTYTGSSVRMQEPDRETLNKMLEAIGELLLVLQHYAGEDRAAVCLTTLREMAEFLNTWRYAFYAADIDAESVEGAICRISETVCSVETFRADLLEEQEKLEKDCETFKEQIRLVWEE